MKILHIATGLPLQYQGGIQNYVRALAMTQAKQGHDVHVLTEKGTYITEHLYKIKVIDTDKNMWGKGRIKSCRKYQYELIGELLEEEKYDLIHVHLVIGLSWKVLELIGQYKYVVSLHDYWFLCPRIQMVKKRGGICEKYDELKCKKCYSLHEKFKLFRGVVKVISKISVEFANKIHIPQKETVIRFERYKKFLEGAKLLLPVSNKVMEVYKDSGVSNRYIVSHIGNVTAVEFDNVPKKNNKDDKIVVAMLGTLIPNKGADLLIKIVSDVKNEKIKFAFYGKSRDYKAKILKYGIEDMGPYKQDELTGILANVHLGLVLPIWHDNAPQVVMEFLNNRIPVIATRMGGIPDFINDKNGYLFNPYNENEICGVIEFLNNLDMEKVEKMCVNIKRTKTPVEHACEMFEIYRGI